MHKTEMKNQEAYAQRPHILVVDDDARIRDLVCKYLFEHGFMVMAADSGAQARDLLRYFSFDAMVVDVMMPGETGLEFVRSMRPVTTLPVLMLTALGDARDRISGLEAGADDYLPKPFEPRELVLRLHAILRRTQVQKERLQRFRIGPWQFDPAMETLSGEQGQEIRLTNVENNLLKALAARPGEVMSREELAERCGLEAGGERTIDVQVTRLRRKIEEDSKAPRYLQTVRGKGYLLRVEFE